ncbi:MAG TPA: MFS transporter [Steroidobacteraceae bacterium]|nr:MFS transporter [Steroidobacteraceae bacterium]
MPGAALQSTDALNARRLFSTAAVIAAATIFGLTYSLSAPLIALDLDKRGFSETFIGANAAMHAVGVLLIAPLLPRLAARLGARRLTLAGLALSALVLLAFPYAPSVYWWFPLRLLLGVGAEALFVMSETWTNELCSEQARGRTMALYTAALSLGMVCGPSVLSAIGPGRDAYLIGAAVSALAIVLVALPWVIAPPRFEPTGSNPLRYMRLAPIAMATTVLNAAIETAGLSFIALYAAGQGWSEQRAMQLISTLMLGAIVLQLPIGWIADRVDRRRLALALAGLSAAGALLWPYVLQQGWLTFAVIFVWGGLFVGIYTVMLAMVGARYRGGELVGIYGAMGFAWGAGALIGPSVAGVAMRWNALFGLPGFVAASCGLFALYMWSSRRAT